MKFISFNQLPLYTDDFFFTFFDVIRNKDAIVVHNPSDALITSPVFLRSRKSLDEHIAYIQSNHIKKAYVVAENIQFLKQCPSLEYIKVFPAVTAENFDYSPLYEMPNLKWVECHTTTGLDDRLVATVDYSRLKGVERIGVSSGRGHVNVDKAEAVRALSLCFGFPKGENLNYVIPKGRLRSLAVCQAPICSLEGIQQATNLQRLELSYNRRLTDISSLRYLCESLSYLKIDTCGRIRDFSVLSKLYNLEFLILNGSNQIQDLSFLQNMRRLKYLQLSVTVQDGDLSRCEQIPYVRIKNRKHYSHKDMDLPKNFIDPDEVCPFELT